MKLTRSVLFEKYITFGYYNSPYKVPEFLWEQAHFVLSQDGILPQDLFKAYAEYVLMPLAKMTNPIISRAYEEGNLKVVFYLNGNSNDVSFESFEVGFEELIDFRMKGPEHLRDFTITVWAKRLT